MRPVQPMRRVVLVGEGVGGRGEVFTSNAALNDEDTPLGGVLILLIGVIVMRKGLDVA